MFMLIAAAITVTTPAELQAAVAKAKCGDVIQLAPGNYGPVALNNPQFTCPVTIKSADPKRRAVVFQITVNNGQNLTLSGFDIAYVPKPGESNSGVMARFNNGSGITLTDMYVHGVVDGRVVDQMNGVLAYNVTGLVISYSRFEAVNAAINTRRSKNVQILGNDISKVGSDGVEIPATDGVSIALNRFHDYRTNPGLHPDGVQCWTTNEKTGCKNVRIFLNDFIGDPGHEMQGVFMGDEAGVGGYDGIEITANRFVCTMWHAINLYGFPANVRIRYNQVTAGPNYQPWIRVDSPALLEGNVAPAFYVANKGLGTPVGNFIGGQR